VSRPARAHTCATMPRWLGHRRPPRTSAVDRPPHLLHAQPMQPPIPRECRTLIPHSGHVETHSPRLPRKPPSFYPTLLYHWPHSSVPSVEHRCWEPLLPPCAPPCRHRLGVRSPSRPPLGADWTSPLTSFPSDQATPPATKDLRDVSPRRSSSNLISAVLSTARTPDNFPTQPPAPNNRRPPPPHHFRLVDHTPPWRALLQ
jgi:hypothetical protein